MQVNHHSIKALVVCCEIFTISFNAFSQNKDKKLRSNVFIIGPNKTNVVRLFNIPEIDASFETLWNKSQMQHDVIGTDFYRKVEIGSCR